MDRVSSQAAIGVSRPHRKVEDRLATYAVFVDGRRVGSLRDGATRSFVVEPGVHQVQLGIAGVGFGGVGTAPVGHWGTGACG
ncbi:MAG TPA: hypothetical protein VLZ77_04770 [Acidimicrobiales bacterium]|nr:hypothetical protein [Acidimicrobiales bacterium]